MSYVQTGAKEPIVALVLDQFGKPLIMSGAIKARVWRVSDGEYLDWFDMTFKPFNVVSRPLMALSEIDRVASPGEYRLDLDTGAIVNPTLNDIYEVTVVNDSEEDSGNLPQVGEIRVGGWVDKVGENYSIVYQSYSYDQVSSTLTGLIWVEKSGLIVSNPVSVTVSFYDADGTLLFTFSDSSPDLQGFFKVTHAAVLTQDRSYYSVANVLLATGQTISGGKGIYTVR